MTFSGLEAEVQNQGAEKLIDLVTSRIKNAERTMMNNISTAVYSDGTGSNSKEIGGLQLLVADTPTTGTVGGIDRSSAANSFWRNQIYRAVTDGGAAASSANIQKYMNNLWISCVRGADIPDLIVSDNTYFLLYLESLQAIQRIASDQSAQAGFRQLKFMSADVIFDGGGGAPSSHMYMLNSDFLFFRPSSKRNMVPLDNKTSINQDATVVPLIWAGNMTCSNASLQGVLQA